MCPSVAEYFLKCLPKLHPRRHYCLFLPVCSAAFGVALIHQRSRTRAPRFSACFAGCPLAARTRKTLLFTRAIRKTAPSASLVFLSLSRSRTRAPRFFACFAGCPLATRTRKTNAAFGVACFSFVLGTLYPRWVLTSTKLLVQYRKFC